MGLSRRGYARHREANGLPGSTLSAVQRALAAGRVTLESDGSIDPERADRDWVSNTSADHRERAMGLPADVNEHGVSLALVEAVNRESRAELAALRERVRQAPDLDDSDQLTLDEIFNAAMEEWK